MRNSQTLSLTYSGTRPQTILFHRDAKIQSGNLAAADALLVAMGAPNVSGPEYARDGSADKWKRSSLWKHVDAAKILYFLGSYATHPNATSAKGPVLADFITKMAEIGQLKQWSVALLAEGDGVGEPHAFSGGISVEKFPMRTPDAPKNPDHPIDPAKFAIGVLTDPSDEGIDLDDDSWRKALALTRAAWQPDSARGRVSPPTIPSGKGIRMARAQLGGSADRGLLLLYPLSPYAGKDKLPAKLIVPGWEKPIMAFAIAFPASDSAIRVEYEVNLLYWEQEYGPTEDTEPGWRSIVLPPSGPLDVRAGRRSPDNAEAVLVGFPTAKIPAADKLPEGQGFAVERADLEGAGKLWIALSRKFTGGTELFTAMSCDVIGALDDAVAAGADEARLARVCIGRVGAWQEFMRKGTQALSPEAEIG